MWEYFQQKFWHPSTPKLRYEKEGDVVSQRFPGLSRQRIRVCVIFGLLLCHAFLSYSCSILRTGWDWTVIFFNSVSYIGSGGSVVLFFSDISFEISCYSSINTLGCIFQRSPRSRGSIRTWSVKWFDSKELSSGFFGGWLHYVILYSISVQSGCRNLKWDGFALRM